MIRRDTFRRLAAGALLPIAGVASAAQSTASGVVGRVHYLASSGAKYATVWTGKTWADVSPGGLGWRQVLADHSPAELGNVAVKVAGEWEWATKYVTKAVTP